MSEGEDCESQESRVLPQSPASIPANANKRQHKRNHNKRDRSTKGCAEQTFKEITIKWDLGKFMS